MAERSKWEESIVLTDEEAQGMSYALQELVGSEGWKTLRELIKSSRVTARELALTGDKLDVQDLAWWQGYIGGLMAAEQIPSLVIGQAERSTATAKTKQVRRREAVFGFHGTGEDPTV